MEQSNDNKFSMMTDKQTDFVIMPDRSICIDSFVSE